MAQLTINLNGESLDVLEKLAQKRGITKTALIRQALGLEFWFDQVVSNGGHVLSEKDGKFMEIVR